MKRTILIVILVLLAVAALVKGLEIWFESKAPDILHIKVAEMTDGMYEVETGKIGINLMSRSISVRGIRFHADSLIIGGKRVPVRSVDVTAAGLKISGIRWKNRKNENRRDFSIRNVVLLDPKIVVVGEKRMKDVENRQEVVHAAKEDVSKVLNYFGVKKIEVRNGSVDYERETNTGREKLVMGSVELRCDDFNTDTTGYGRSRFFTAEISGVR